MHSSFREQGPGTQPELKRFLVVSLHRIIQWLAGLIKLTEAEQEKAGIYLDRLGGE